MQHTTNQADNHLWYTHDISMPMWTAIILSYMVTHILDAAVGVQIWSPENMQWISSYMQLQWTQQTALKLHMCGVLMLTSWSSSDLSGSIGVRLCSVYIYTYCAHLLSELWQVIRNLHEVGSVYDNNQCVGALLGGSIEQIWMLCHMIRPTDKTA